MPKKAGRSRKYPLKTGMSKNSKRRNAKKRGSRPKLNQYTPYYYKFDLLPNVLASGTAPGGAIVEFILGSGQVGGLPFTTSACLSTPVGSGTLFANTYDFGFATAFKLSDITNYQLYTALYDAYKITAIDLEVTYLANMQGASGKGTLPTLYLYNDQDSADVPTLLSDIQGKTGLRSLELGNKATTTFRHRIKPFTSTLQNAGNSLGYGYQISKANQWIDCNSANVWHYALKGYITDLYVPLTADVTQAFKFKWTYHVEFRGPLKAY